MKYKIESNYFETLFIRLPRKLFTSLWHGGMLELCHSFSDSIPNMPVVHLLGNVGYARVRDRRKVNIFYLEKYNILGRTSI